MDEDPVNDHDVEQLLTRLKHLLLFSPADQKARGQLAARAHRILSTLFVHEDLFHKLRIVKEICTTLSHTMLPAVSALVKSKLAEGAPLADWDATHQCAELSKDPAFQQSQAIIIDQLQQTIRDFVSWRPTGSSMVTNADSDSDLSCSDAASDSSSMSNQSDGVLSFSSFHSHHPLDRIHAVASQILDVTVSDGTALSAVMELASFNPGDIIHSEHWPIVKATVLFALQRRHPSLLQHILQFVSKMFAEALTVSPVHAGELCHALLIHIATEKPSLNVGEDGIMYVPCWRHHLIWRCLSCSYMSVGRLTSPEAIVTVLRMKLTLFADILCASAPFQTV